MHKISVRRSYTTTKNHRFLLFRIIARGRSGDSRLSSIKWHVCTFYTFYFAASLPCRPLSAPSTNWVRIINRPQACFRIPMEARESRRLLILDPKPRSGCNAGVWLRICKSATRENKTDIQHSRLFLRVKLTLPLVFNKKVFYLGCTQILRNNYKELLILSCVQRVF